MCTCYKTAQSNYLNKRACAELAINRMFQVLGGMLEVIRALLSDEIRDRLGDLGTGYKVTNATCMGKCKLDAIPLGPRSNKAQPLRFSNRKWLI